MPSNASVSSGFNESIRKQSWETETLPITVSLMQTRERESLVEFEHLGFVNLTY